MGRRPDKTHRNTPSQLAAGEGYSDFNGEGSQIPQTSDREVGTGRMVSERERAHKARSRQPQFAKTEEKEYNSK